MSNTNGKTFCLHTHTNENDRIKNSISKIYYALSKLLYVVCFIDYFCLPQFEVDKTELFAVQHTIFRMLCVCAFNRPRNSTK